MYNYLRRIHIPVGMRTVKTAIAVTIALVIIEYLGASSAKIIFAVIGAIAAMENSFMAALRSCMAQIVGVMMGSLLGLAMHFLPIPGEVAVGLGIIVTMAVFQLLHWHYSPVLACIVLVTICTNPDINALPYGLARLWDTAIGLAVGLAVNMLLLPYNNSKKIRRLLFELDREIVVFLEDMFDDDGELPGTSALGETKDELELQLAIFADQRLFRRKRQRRVLRHMEKCQDSARELLVELRTLRNMDCTGRLNEANRRRLKALGAKVPKIKGSGEFSTEEIVINYHVSRLLDIRERFKAELEKTRWKKKREKTAKMLGGLKTVLNNSALQLM